MTTSAVAPAPARKPLVQRIRHWFRTVLECRTKRCSYYQHYLAYGPADLTHVGYHAAERHCERAQQRITDWLDTHPTGQPPKYLVEHAGTWEQRVRA